MINFSFSISPFLKSELEEIDKNRVKTLLTLVRPQTDIALKYQASLERIISTTALYGKPTSHKVIEKALTAKKRADTDNQEIVALFNTYTQIYFDWFMNSEPLSLSDLIHIHRTFSTRPLDTHRKDLDLMLTFIQSNPEHPVIQAALARILLFQILGNQEHSLRMGSLLAWIFLVKNGYDIHQCLDPEGSFVDKETLLTNVMQNALVNKNISAYLEHYTHGVLTQTEKVRKRLKEASENEHLNRQKTVHLSDRQIEILSYLDKPASTISNRVVQKLFGVSQITASRDLAQLAELNLIYAVGKGRSSAFVKVRS